MPVLVSRATTPYGVSRWKQGGRIETQGSVFATPRNLQLLVVFSAVAKETSFTKAAEKLGIAKGTVSRSIALLESQLQVELVHRTTRHVSLSTAGLALYERTRAPLAALNAAVTELPELDDEPSGRLRLTAPHDFGTIELPGLLAAFSRRHPGVRFDVRLTGERVDLVKEGFDLAIRMAVGQLRDSALLMRRLVKHSSAFYAAPSYVARRGKPRRLGDERHTWVLHPGAIRMLQLAADDVQFIVDDFQMARDLARDGAGIALLPSFVGRDSVREGLLEEVSVADVAPIQSSLVLLYPSSRHVPKKVTSFRDFLVEALNAGV